VILKNILNRQGARVATFSKKRFCFLGDLGIVTVKKALIKAVRGELVEPRTHKSPAIYVVSRSPFDELRANGRLNQLP